MITLGQVPKATRAETINALRTEARDSNKKAKAIGRTRS